MTENEKTITIAQLFLALDFLLFAKVFLNSFSFPIYTSKIYVSHNTEKTFSFLSDSMFCIY